MLLDLPASVTALLLVFAPLFSHRVWQSAQIILIGAILAPGKRTITSILRVMGLSEETHFQNYHRVLNRARWSCLGASRRLLSLLVHTFAPRGPIIMGIDDTIERRKGAKIKAKGIYRDPVRSSQTQTVKVSGLRWLSLMLLAPIPWAQRIWALPFLSVLAPSQGYSERYCNRHKTLSHWARQMFMQVRRWWPNRDIIVVADSSFAVLDLLHAMRQPKLNIAMITRLRLDAGLYEPAPPTQPGQMGRPRVKGERLPYLSQILTNEKTQWHTLTLERWYGQTQRVVEYTSQTAVWYHSGKPVVPLRWVLVRDPLEEFESQALLCTDINYTAAQILSWFVMRWQVEVTFEEARAHLGMETQRQWSDLAISRTTPSILGLFSIVTLLADAQYRAFGIKIRTAAWYKKSRPTFSDAIAWVRYALWHATFSMSSQQTDMQKVSTQLLERMTDILCYAA